MTRPPPEHNTTMVVQAARVLCEQTAPILLCRPRSKKPIPSPDSGGWWVIDDPWAVEQQLQRAAALGYPRPNLGVLLGAEKASLLVCLDADGPDGLAQLKALGVASNDSCWIAQTPHSGTHIFYHRPQEPLPPRLVRAGKLPLDLLINGFALVAPSVIDGKPYRWIRGHGPQDIPVAELQDIPGGVVRWWREQRIPGSARPIAPVDSEASGSSKAWQLLNALIPTGERHDTFVSLAGSMRRRGMSVASIEAALLEENATRCDPPLPETEVRGDKGLGSLNWNVACLCQLLSRLFTKCPIAPVPIILPA